ncbi:MAG: tetratricopeptide repeat protein, partial [Candidatus Electrothrix sp. AR3]|nr:tetratricopeptide repeat protein [Candidatus Electrothrix sp. AR3]
HGLGTLMREQKRFEEAEQAYRRAIEIDSDYVYSWHGLGTLMREQKRFGEAEQAYRRAIEIDSGDVYSWNNLGTLMRKQKRFNEAEQAYKRAIEIDPDKVYSWFVFGTFMIEQKRFDEAEQAYKRAIETDPDYVYSWYGLGTLMIKQKRFKEAENAYKKAINVKPKDAMAHNILAWFLYEKGEFDEAIILAQKSVGFLSENNLHAVHTLATLLIANNQWEEASVYISSLFNKGNDEFFDKGWQDMLILFKETVRTNRATEALQLLDKTPYAERWRPLREALAAAAQGTSRYLNGVAPEVRQPALVLLKQIAPKILENEKVK